MRTLAIYTGRYFESWNHESVKKGIGGSETWAFEISREFSERGYYVVLYADTDMEYIISDKFRIRHYSNFQIDASSFRYDYIIVSRLLSVINPWIKCDNIYAMVHDVEFVDYTLGYGLDRYKRYGYLSDWHKNNLMNLYPEIPEDRFLKVTNGYSSEYYNPDSEKTNSMVWSSSLVRGLFDIYRLVIMDLIKEIPDFTVYVCCGTNHPYDLELLDKARYLPNVVVLNHLGKEDLARYQNQSKIWVYPGIFQETFCITALENCAAGCGIICPPSYGLKTTLKDYNLWDLGFTRDILNDSNAHEYLELAIRFIKDRDNPTCKSLLESSRSLAKHFSWKRAADEWEAAFNEDIR